MGIELTDVQKQALKRWVAEGCGLAEIQKRLAAEFGLSPTYMDVRFLIIDLGLQIKEQRQKSTGPAELRGAASSGRREAAGKAPAASPAGVSVQMDRVTKPGSLVCGTVTFSDGMSGSWMLDQFGRLGLNMNKKGYNPTPEDVQAFQEELRSLLEARGF
jgi:hypothetical protein